MKIIAFSGKKQSGKTTAVNDLENRLNLTQSTVELNFADYLKQIIRKCFRADYYSVNGSDEQKNTTLRCGTSGRALLQLIGTDWFRSIDPNCWVNAYKHDVGFMCSYIIITADVRFPNEVKCIQELGGHVIRLLRNPHDDQHESETALDVIQSKTKFRDGGGIELRLGTDANIFFDAVIDNRNMSVAETSEKIWKLVNEREWI